MAQMPGPELKTIGDILFWSYANLAMAHAAVADGARSYQRKHFMIRARLFRGLLDGRMDLGSIVDDERVKMEAGGFCCYCGASGPLTSDHLIPRHRGGPDSADNVVWCCRICNSSKGSSDLLAWYSSRGEFPPLLLLRRYLKLAIEHCRRRNWLDTRIEEARDLDAPIVIGAVPLSFPSPSRLRLWAQPGGEGVEGPIG
jgi:hypothetical protein